MQKSIRKLLTIKLNVIVNMVGHYSVITSEENPNRDTKEIKLAATYEDIIERWKQFKSLIMTI